MNQEPKPTDETADNPLRSGDESCKDEFLFREKNEDVAMVGDRRSEEPPAVPSSSKEFEVGTSQFRTTNGSSSEDIRASNSGNAPVATLEPVDQNPISMGHDVGSHNAREMEAANALLELAGGRPRVTPSSPGSDKSSRCVRCLWDKKTCDQKRPCGRCSDQRRECECRSDDDGSVKKALAERRRQSNGKKGTGEKKSRGRPKKQKQKL
jgi:hypothetical protein